MTLLLHFMTLLFSLFSYYWYMLINLISWHSYDPSTPKPRWDRAWGKVFFFLGVHRRRSTWPVAHVSNTAHGSPSGSKKWRFVFFSFWSVEGWSELSSWLKLTTRSGSGCGLWLPYDDGTSISRVQIMAEYPLQKKEGNCSKHFW